MMKAAPTIVVSVSSLRFAPRRSFVRVGAEESRSLMRGGAPSGLAIGVTVSRDQTAQVLPGSFPPASFLLSSLQAGDQSGRGTFAFRSSREMDQRRPDAAPTPRLGALATLPVFFKLAGKPVL